MRHGPVYRETPLSGCYVIESRVHADERGLFLEAFRQGAEGSPVADVSFVQGNVSVSRAGVLRGLHLQWPHAQGKLVSVLKGSAWDVAVDVRQGSPTFGQWSAVTLDASNRRQFWIPGGFAHGFVALEDETIFSYFCDETYHPECELGIDPFDPHLAIDWPIRGVTMSSRDANAPMLRDIPVESLPKFPVPAA